MSNFVKLTDSIIVDVEEVAMITLAHREISASKSHRDNPENRETIITVTFKYGETQILPFASDDVAKECLDNFYNAVKK